MRISDWSSDVCSSDLARVPRAGAPLAARMRPRSLDEYEGQQHIIGPGGPLRRMIESDELPSIILWGSPGCGKTTLARIIADNNSRHIEELSAATSGIADVRRSGEEAEGRRRLSGVGPIRCG